MKTLYPDISPFNSDFLVQGSHKIYFEESGNPDGKPVVFLHGGPGGGGDKNVSCLLYTSPSPRDKRQSRMPSSA